MAVGREQECRSHFNNENPVLPPAPGGAQCSPACGIPGRRRWWQQCDGTCRCMFTAREPVQSLRDSSRTCTPLWSHPGAESCFLHPAVWCSVLEDFHLDADLRVTSNEVTSGSWCRPCLQRAAQTSGLAAHLWTRRRSALSFSFFFSSIANNPREL